MLRITVHNGPAETVLKLEGKLATAWVDELGRFSGSLLRGNRSIALDLTDVTYVDFAGKRMLASLVEQGARLISDDAAMDALVAEIARDDSRAESQQR